MGNYYKKNCECSYCFPEGKAIWICDKSPLFIKNETKFYLTRLFSILFLPKKISKKFHFTIESIPIGWLIIMLSAITNLIIWAIIR